MLRRVLTFFGYLALALAIVGVTVGLVAYGNDYTYDFRAHRLIQKGHIIIESLPSGVSVKADGKDLNKRTPYQGAYNIGDHTLRLEKDGFWPWEKVLQVVAGRVALANYVILVPKQPKETELDHQAQIVAQAISKDHRHVAYITGGADPALYTLDVGAKKTVRLYAPQPATPTQGPEALKDVEWSDDASRLLVASDVAGTPTHRLVVADGGAPTNLTQVFGFNLTGLHFSGSNSRQLYWLSPDGLRRLDVDANTVSGVLADKVSQFWVQPDRVLYVQQTELGRSLWSLDNRGRKQVLIQALVESDSYSVALARYSGEDELAVVPARTGVATLYSGVFGDRAVAKVIGQGVSGVSFSPEGNALALLSPTGVSVYDLERSALEQSFVRYSFPNQGASLSNLTWYDNYHVLFNRDGRLYWSEFDGANEVALSAGYAGLPGYRDADKRGVILFQPIPTGSVRVVGLAIR